MGITIHYRGTMNDLSEVETMENRMLDLVYSLGGRAAIWRSFGRHDNSRVVRGLLINMEPGQESFSLLISPEGHLTSPFQIEDAEREAFDEPPYCSVKTQFGSLQGHIAIVHLLDALRQRFCSNLEVSDEGEYFEARDVNLLAHRMQRLGAAINALSQGLQHFGLSSEAAEDPSILATRIERIAALVQQKLCDEQEKPIAEADSFNPSTQAGDADGDSETDWSESSLEEDVAAMDLLRRKNDLRCERMNRRISESIESGLSVEEAFALAMREEGLTAGAQEQAWDSTRAESFENAEHCQTGLSQHLFDAATEPSESVAHPAVLQARAFLDIAMKLQRVDSSQATFHSMLLRASLGMVGALVQATSAEDGTVDRALAITQLKRALASHAYAQGALFGLRSDEAITVAQLEDLYERLQALQASIRELAAIAWS